MSYRFRRIHHVVALDGRPMRKCSSCRDGIAYSKHKDAICTTCRAERHRVAALAHYHSKRRTHGTA